MTLKQDFIGLLIGFIIKVYSSTFRYEVIIHHEEDRKKVYEDLFNSNKSEKSLIYAAFHQDEMASIPFFSFKNIYILVSKSKDGALLAAVLHFLGYKTVRGSSHRGGVAGLIAAIKTVKQGFKMTFAVDGPRGPRYQVKEGICKLSEKCQKPIVPLRAHPKRFYLFDKSWSHSKLPLPFSKIQIHIGKVDFYTPESLSQYMLSLSPEANT